MSISISSVLLFLLANAEALFRNFRATLLSSVPSTGVEVSSGLILCVMDEFLVGHIFVSTVMRGETLLALRTLARTFLLSEGHMELDVWIFEASPCILLTL